MKYEFNEFQKYENEFLRFSKGILKEKFYFLDGKKHGICETYFVNKPGFLSTKFNYSNGKKDGKSFCWNFNSEKNEYFLEYEIDYKDKKRHGNYIKYFDNGSIKILMKFDNGKSISERKEFLKNGEPVKMLTFWNS